MAGLYYKFSVYTERKNGKMEKYADCTTETKARALGIQLLYPRVTPWIKNNETGLFIGMIERYNNYGIMEYIYTTTDSRERKINKDGTFVKKTKKTKPAPFGL